jgi:hypothetical protein
LLWRQSTWESISFISYSYKDCSLVFHYFSLSAGYFTARHVGCRAFWSVGLVCLERKD